MAGGRRVSVNYLAETVARLVDSTAAPRYEPARQGDVRDSQADLAKAQRLLGWKPRVGFDDGLRQAVEWFRE